MKKILIVCEESQRVCISFRERGFEAYSCDLLDCSGGHPEWHIKGNCLSFVNGNCSFYTVDGTRHIISGVWDLVVGHPPCTYFSNATAVNLGRKDNPDVFNEEWRNRFFANRDLMYDLFLHIYNCNAKYVAVENVIGYLNTHFRKPDQIVQPFYFGEPYRKATCLWLRNLPLLNPTEIVVPTCKWVRHTLKERNDLDGYLYKGRYTAKERSTTFWGIARAMAVQWGNFLENNV